MILEIILKLKRVYGKEKMPPTTNPGVNVFWTGVIGVPDPFINVYRVCHWA
jgi:hypothetical protein